MSRRQKPGLASNGAPTCGEFLPTKTRSLDAIAVFCDKDSPQKIQAAEVMRKRAVRRLLGALFCIAMTGMISHGAAASTESCPAPLTNGIPKRADKAPGGSEIMQALRQTRGRLRDDAIIRQVLSGNVPVFLRKLVPVEISGTLPNGEQVSLTICVTPEYLAVGNDDDFVRVPLGLPAAARVASELGFFLPTPKMVDAIYSQARIHLPPQPMTPSAQMESTDYLLRHNATLQDQLRKNHFALAELTAGQKKDIVLTNRLRSKPGHVAIYGWHQLNGRPIQPLSTVHGKQYADYSHGVRLVSQTAFVNGKQMDLGAIMQDQELASVVSSEGPINDAHKLLASLF